PRQRARHDHLRSRHSLGNRIRARPPAVVVADLWHMRLALALVLTSTAASATPRQTSTFHAVEAAAVIDVDITVGPATSVDITGDADEVAKLETKVESGTLVLRTRAHGREHGRGHLHATITTP